MRITNLSEEATENDVQELCRNFGAISRIYVAKDKVTGQSKGFGFVSFATAIEADAALAALNGAMIAGRQIRIEKTADEQ